MSSSFMILFMASVDTWLNKNLPLIFNFFYCFYILVKGNFFNNGVNCFILWWYFSIFGPTKEIWRVCSWSETFIGNLSDILLFWYWSFSSRIVFFCIFLLLFEKYSLHAFQNDLELQFLKVPHTLSFSKYCNLACLFRFATRFHCHLNLTMSIEFFELFELIWRRYLIIICSWRFIFNWGFWFSCKFFYFPRSIFI